MQRFSPSILAVVAGTHSHQAWAAHAVARWIAAYGPVALYPRPLATIVDRAVGHASSKVPGITLKFSLVPS